MNLTINPTKKLIGEIIIPPDKSLSHRAAIFSVLTKGIVQISNFSKGADCHNTLKILQELGSDIRFLDEQNLIINSTNAFVAPKDVLYAGNSGTTIRLMSGVLAGQNFESVLSGDESLSKRPMGRVITPLRLMGADITSLNNDDKAPLTIKGQKLNAIHYDSPIASAQVKSCILLAGLSAEGITSVNEPYKSRDHSELMLKYLDANIETEGNLVKIQKSELTPKPLKIAGDISSAAFFMVAAAIVPNSEVTIKNVGLNPTRTGIIDVLQKMGADIEILDKKVVCGEDVGDVKIKYSDLKGITIEKDIIPRLIDELPVIAVLATQAKGQTIIKDAQDLRNKESDRIKTICNELRKIGANIEETPDGFIIEGKTTLKGDAILDCYHDHRLAMSFYVAGLICANPVIVNEFQWVETSFPEFEKIMNNLKN